MNHSTAVTGFQVATFVVAVLAFAVASSALIWQIIAWRRTGSVAKVELLVGVEQVTGHLLMRPLDGFDPSKFEVPTLAFFFVVRVRNKGRTAVDVDDWFIGANNDGGFSVSGHHRLGQRPPARVEPGSKAEFVMAAADAHEFLPSVFEIGEEAIWLRAQATLGTGALALGGKHAFPFWLFDLYGPVPDRPDLAAS